VREHVILHDRYFSGDEVGQCFAAADAVVLPYRSATQSGVIPTALALDTPVIATRAGGLEEAMSAHAIGVVIERPEPPAIANAVNAFYASGGSAAFRDALSIEEKHGSWEQMTTVIESLR
jgi:glycosyltransferase involved in cell wall biosynthesis